MWGCDACLFTLGYPIWHVNFLLLFKNLEPVLFISITDPVLLSSFTNNLYLYIIYSIQVLPSDLFGWFKWPFQGLSDIHLGDQKVTWKKLDEIYDVYLSSPGDGANHVVSPDFHLPGDD